LATILKLGDKSGLNKKSLINSTNSVYSKENTEVNLEEVSPNLRKYYKIFWQNMEYISNPLKLLEKSQDKTQKSNQKFPQNSLY
jgi:hypothetical protein